MARAVASWGDPSKYPKRDACFLPNRWAWEFLRRNPGYQDDWQMFQSLKEAILAGNGGGESLIEDQRYWYYEPERMAGEDDAAWRLRARGMGGKRTPIINRLADKWKLAMPHLPNPFMPSDSPEINRIGFITGVRVSDTAHWIEDELPEHIRKTQIAFVIDLTRPIENQVDALRRVAVSRQNRRIAEGTIEAIPKINQRPEWPLYLRLLDAELDGVSKPDEIAAKLYGGQHGGKDNDPDSLRRRIEKNMTHARSLRDSGYLWIAATAQTRRNNFRTRNGSMT